ncbi:right-handed parallel beta-helix repeat-containing protein [Paenibacillus sp. L3-i20]|uniref:right-handed parallel beta-helix repeat-containing protein n=1 Tax=Paenibacillus sp. L3-i20 TaxID=2905833 RepID=UPI0020C00E38|nr:right-handed parallel beta-helix repeat-containing protein [Paenibacillus sp. L3-i20]
MIVTSYLPSAVFSSSSGRVYYVANSGDDANLGTIDAPWRTIQKAADTLTGGDTVYVRGGIYEEFVSISSSGSEPTGFITFQAFPGEQPIVDGSKLSISNGESALIRIRNSNYIVIEGFEVRNLSSSSSSEYPAGIRVDQGGSNIHLLNNNIHQIKNLSPDGNAHGIHIYGNTHLPLTNIKVGGNEIHHLILGSSESLTVSGNVDGFSVENNTVHDNNNIGIDIAGFYGACSTPCIDQARNGMVSGNVVYNIDSSVNSAYDDGFNSAPGIYADGSNNVVIERNHVYNNDFGISIASEVEGKTTSNITVQSNYIHHNDGAGIIMGGSEASNGGATNNFIMNNTLIKNDTLGQGFGEIALQENNFNNSIINNILYSLPGNQLFSKYNSSGSNNKIDYNLYYRMDGKDKSYWEWEGQSYSKLEDFRAATSFDAHSIFADPKLADTQNGSILLNDNSPAIDRGIDNDAMYDFFGSSRKQGAAVDIGASEFNGSLSATTPPPIPTEVSPVTPTPPIPTEVSPVTPTPPIPTAVPPITPTPPIPTEVPPVTPTPPIPTEVSPVTPIPTIAPTPPTGRFIIDGNFTDWNDVDELTTGTSNVKAIKALITDDALNILVTGHLLGEKGQLYINTDGNSKTGFQARYWSGAGADYLLENGILYSYSGKGGTNWGWKEIRSYKKLGNFIATSTVVEASISLADLGGVQSGTVELGYVWKDSHENRLPMGKNLLPAQDEETTGPHPGEKPIIEIDGEERDWVHVASLSSSMSNPKVMRVTNDAEYLYILIEGSKLTSKVQLYFDTDQDEQTGYKTSKWDSTGAEYLIENGRLYSYTGKGSNWSWRDKSNLKQNKAYAGGDSIIEMAIPLSILDLNTGEIVKLGVMIDDNKKKQLPLGGELAGYTLVK